MTATRVQSGAVPGRFFEAKSSKSRRGYLAHGKNGFRILGAKGAVVHEGLKVSQLPGRRDAYFTDGQYFSADADLPLGLRKRMQSGQSTAIDWLSVFSPSRVIALVLVAVLAAIALRLVFFSVSEIVVSAFPKDWERAIGAAAFEQFDSRIAGESAIDPEYMESIANQGRSMALLAEIEPAPDILFRDIPRLGPNALAFPGGPVVLTDQLVDSLDEDEVLAVVAHELAHVEARHSLEQIVETTGLVLLTTALFGGGDAVVENLANVAITLRFFINSREHEAEADSRAVEFLILSGRDPSTMERALGRLYELGCEQEGVSELGCEAGKEAVDGWVFGFGWLSTHPPTDERIHSLGEHRSR